MLSGGKQLGVCLILAGLVAAALLLFQPKSTVQADLRLDDYETSWPNHVEVQEIGASHVDQLNGGALPVAASARKDRSTIAIIADEGTPPRLLDELVDRVVDQDAISRNSNSDDQRNRLEQLLGELARSEASANDPTELSNLSTETVTLRREIALDSVAAGSTRSRFVALYPASERTAPLPVLQWVMATGLIAVGLLIVVRTQR